MLYKYKSTVGVWKPEQRVNVMNKGKEGDSGGIVMNSDDILNLNKKPTARRDYQHPRERGKSSLANRKL